MFYIHAIRILINFFDKCNQKKIINFLRNKFNYPILAFDVGAHHGETIELFKKNFKIKEIHAFEASPKNFKILKKKVTNFNLGKIVLINNIGLGREKKKTYMSQVIESSSSTIHKINKNSNYLKKKNKILRLFSSSLFSKKIVINLDKAENYIKENKIDKIDLFKIDTEGYEYNILKGLGKKILNIKYIYFEHHYDDMIIKNYSFSDIHKLLTKNKFKKVIKNKMLFRKSFEYVYFNTKN